MSKKKKAIHREFEGRDPRGAFVKLTRDMMNSAAWEALDLRARGLYTEMKSEFRIKIVHEIVESSNEKGFIFPKDTWRKIYGSWRTFNDDLEKLINHGFIEKVGSGANTRTPNTYAYSDGWKKWQPDKNAQRK